MLLDSLPSCFSTNPGALVIKTTSPKMPQNIVTSIYQATICGTPTFVTLTWCATLSAAHSSLTVNIVDSSFSLSIPLSPSSAAFSFFRTRPGSKTVTLPANAHHRHCRRPHRLLWDFSRAHFPANSAEPVSGFYLAVVHEGRVEFLLGDLVHDLGRRAGLGSGSGSGSPPLPAPAAESAVLLSRREHVFGRRRYATRARFLGSTSHDIEVECSGGALRVKVDGAVGLVVKRLAWKFRGNEKIVVGGSEVEFYWDVFNWVCAGGGAGGGGGGHGLFVFQVGDGGVWPEMLGPEKKLMRKSCSMSPSMSPGNWSVMQWSEEKSEGGRSFCSSSSASSRSSSSSSSITPNCSGFSLLLYAWKTAD